MTSAMLSRLDVTNFRSIRGHVTASLKANTVLVHGENGAGKTSLLSAIELALCGGFDFLNRADKNYRKQLLHRGSDEGRVALDTLGLPDINHFEITIDQEGTTPVSKLNHDLADFFKERCYLPQSLLGQLLKIYEDSGSEPESPLSTFVSELLGLNRLDTIETGLGPADDIRNLRKTSERLGQFEFEQERLDRQIKEHRARLEAIDKLIAVALADLHEALRYLGIEDAVSQNALANYREMISSNVDERAYATNDDHRRQIQAVLRENERSGDTGAIDEEALATIHREASKALAHWNAAFEQSAKALRDRVARLLPITSLPGDLTEFLEVSLRELRTLQTNAMARATRANADAERAEAIAEERAAAQSNLTTAESEIGRISEDAGSLGTALAEISSFITSDVCPVCERDFAEVGRGSLANHVGDHVRLLSSSAQRLLDLGKTKSDLQVRMDRLDREAAEISSRRPTPQILTALGRDAAELGVLVVELEGMRSAFEEGSRSAREETSARRRLSELQALNLSRLAILETLSELALSMGLGPATSTDTVSSTVKRLQAAVTQRAETLNARMTARRRALEAIERAEREVESRREIQELFERDFEELVSVKNALGRASEMRSDAQSIKSAVEGVRSAIIRREFNERLNRLWRDLFVRLAPNEPFVPAFKIPDVTTQKLQPKLITEHRYGGPGGTPGAMLSAGNLNTAALTLFTALHLRMKPILPWLILDDPVQSMDDIHIAHFAALLRTVAKEQRRQVIIAVHDRQLFEYLRLELSPAFPTDTLQTLELSRGRDRDTLCLPRHYEFQEETAVQAA
jgi:exonuclease SbcC